MKLLLSSLLILSVLAIGISQAEAEMISIETDKTQYYIGDEIKISVTVDGNDTHETDMTFRIMTVDESNIITIGQAHHIEGNLYEAVIGKIKDSNALESGEHILWTTRGEQEADVKQPIILIKKISEDPNRPKYTNEIEVDPIFGTACRAEGDILNDKGQCVKEFPDPIEITEMTISLSQYEELQQENLELKLENRQLQNRVTQLTDEIVRMTDEFIITITNQMNWFISQKSN